MKTSMNENREQEPTVQIHTVTTKEQREKEFNEAVERVYRIYGPDLSAFYRDVKKELERRDRRKGAL